MTWAAVGVVLLLGALWLVLPDPRRRLRTLGSAPPDGLGLIGAALRGRSGAPPMRQRVWVGALVGVPMGFSSHMVFPTVPAVVVGLLVAAVIVVVGGRIVAPSSTAGILQAELADTVELLAVCLAAGSSMRHALSVVAEVSETETAAVLGRVSGPLGLGVVEQRAWLELRSDPTWGPVACDVARSARSGTSLVEVLHVHAEEARMIARERAMQRARTAGVRSVVPLMACFLPAFVLVGVVPIIAGLLSGLLSP